jgi:hypothetical protein
MGLRSENTLADPPNDSLINPPIWRGGLRISLMCGLDTTGCSSPQICKTGTGYLRNVERKTSSKVGRNQEVEQQKIYDSNSHKHTGTSSERYRTKTARTLDEDYGNHVKMYIPTDRK